MVALTVHPNPMNDVEIFIQSVQKAPELPAEVKTHAAEVASLRTMVFDNAFISLLDTQLRLSTRGPEWADKVTRQKEALRPYRDKRLLKGRIQLGLDAYWIYVDPDTQGIAYWECYENWAEQA